MGAGHAEGENMMVEILVTGGLGFISSYLVNECESSGHMDSR